MRRDNIENGCGYGRDTRKWLTAVLGLLLTAFLAVAGLGGKALIDARELRVSLAAAQQNMPTREEVGRLDERLKNIEGTTARMLRILEAK